MGPELNLVRVGRTEPVRVGCPVLVRVGRTDLVRVGRTELVRVGCTEPLEPIITRCRCVIWNYKHMTEVDNMVASGFVKFSSSGHWLAM